MKSVSRYDPRRTADLFADAIRDLTEMAGLHSRLLTTEPRGALTATLLRDTGSSGRQPGMVHPGDIVFDHSQTALRAAFTRAGVTSLPLVPGPGWTVPPSSVALMFRQAGAIRDARAFTFDTPEQVRALASSPLPQDFSTDLLFLPFPAIFIDFAAPAPVAVQFTSPDDIPVTTNPRAVLLTEHRLKLQRWTIPQLGRTLTDARAVTHTATVFADPAGAPPRIGLPQRSLHYVADLFWSWPQPFTYEDAMRLAGDTVEDRMFWDLVARVLLFIHSPTIVQERAQTTPYLRATATEVGRTTDPAPYVLRIRAPRVARRSALGLEAATRHFAYRFDVRGHWKHFRKGRLAGRVIWCPAFIKGPADRPYRPRLNVLAGTKS